MTWLVLSNGAEQHLSGPGARSAQYTLQSIAHQLAQINRYTGATRRPYSVAEHSLLCADLAQDAGLPPLAQLCCLMHDAHECVTGDMATPIKHLLGQPWARFENEHARHLRDHFGLFLAFDRYLLVVRHIDRVALATERRDLLPYNADVNAPWPIIDQPGRALRPDERNLASAWREQRHWSEWRDAFMERYEELSAQEVEA